MVSGTISASWTIGSIGACGPSCISWRDQLGDVDEPAHAVAVFVLGHHQARVAARDAQLAARVSTSWEMSIVTTAGIGVITWRASCSCR